MRVVLDTNIFIAALIAPGGSNYRLVEHWRRGNYTLLTSEAQISELRRVSKEKLYKGLIRGSQAGTLVKLIRRRALMLNPGPVSNLSPDPDDNLIVAIAIEGEADYLASLNMQHVVKLEKVGKTKVLHAKELLKLL